MPPLRLSKKSVIVKIGSQFNGFFSLDFIYKSGGDSKLYSLKTSLLRNDFDLLRNSRPTVPMYADERELLVFRTFSQSVSVPKKVFRHAVRRQWEVPIAAAFSDIQKITACKFGGNRDSPVAACVAAIKQFTVLLSFYCTRRFRLQRPPQPAADRTIQADWSCHRFSACCLHCCRPLRSDRACRSDGRRG